MISIVVVKHFKIVIKIYLRIKEVKGVTRFTGVLVYTTHLEPRLPVMMNIPSESYLRGLKRRKGVLQ